MPVDLQETRLLTRLANTLSDKLGNMLRNLFDTVYANDDKAREFLGVSRVYFETSYKPYCGIKQGNAMVYRKSDLLKRMEQLRVQGGGVDADVDDTDTD